MASSYLKLAFPESYELKSGIIHDEAIQRMQGLSKDINKRWLCDEGLNGALGRIIYYAQKNSYGMDVYIFCSYFWERLRSNLDYACDVASSILQCAKMRSKWLIPICMNDHWIAAIIRREECCIEIMDSLHIQHTFVTEKLKQFLQYVCPKISDWKVVYDKDIVPLQTNSYDCGVLIIKGLEHEVYKDSNIILPRIVASKGHLYRQEIVEMINSSASENPDNYSPSILRPSLEKEQELKPQVTTHKPKISLSLKNRGSSFEKKSLPVNKAELNISSEIHRQASSSQSEAICDSLPHNECTVESDVIPRLEKSGIQPLSNHSTTYVSDANPTVWSNLETCLRDVLPNEEGITYIVMDLVHFTKETFLGAPAHSFKSSIRINLHNEKDGKKWLQSMMEHSKCTYRQSRGRKPGCKRVVYKIEMHCQHKRKPLTQGQIQQNSAAKIKNSGKGLKHETRQKKTDCPSVIKLVLKIPTKKDQRVSADYPYFVSHPAIFQVSYNHNHPVESAHSLSFRPILPETKESFFKLFQMGHSASSAFHWNETKLLLDGGDDQLQFADRANNPTKPDISRLYNEWRKKELGPDNGKELFEKLEMEILSYNEANQENGGQARLMVYQNDRNSCGDSDGESEGSKQPPKKKKKRSQPMVIVICTPLMSRVHQNVQQSREMVFCDATSSLDRFNTSLFVLSTANAVGGLPLGVIITSDEEQGTIRQGLDLLKTILPSNCFYGNGSEKGPSIIMTDDSCAERNALHEAWPKSSLLLCTFHFLQRNWTWLHDGANKVFNADRKLLIEIIKNLVYSENEKQLLDHYTSFNTSETAKKYPKYITYVGAHWNRRREWAVCFRKHLLVRGNHTNNYSEAGIRILKELIFSRVKAYNHVQMFSFITECMELYYRRKLLSAAHNRLDRYISLKYQGLNCNSISPENISVLDLKARTYLVNSQSERGVKHLVDMALGVCSCNAGRDGSPCSHQAAIAKHCHLSSVNCIPVCPKSRQVLANIALGSKSIQEFQFYSSLHEKKLLNSSPIQSQEINFDGSAWDLVRGLASTEDSSNDQIGSKKEEDINYEDILEGIKDVFTDLELRIKDSVVVAKGTKTFIRRYKDMITHGKFSNAALGSAMYKFGWNFGGSIQSTQGGHFRRGHRIPISAKAAGRRRGNSSRGKGKALCGRPKCEFSSSPTTKFTMKPRREPKGKRLHSLQASISRGTQNGGKW